MKIVRKPTVRTGRLRLPSGTLFWHEGGQGETLVFLHGTWQDSLQWLPLLQTLSADFHCLAPDCLGFGESKYDPKHYSIQLQVEALAAFLQTLRVSRCYLIGQSLGAWVAVQFALQYPDQVQGLVVIEPEGLAPTLDRSRWRLHRLLLNPLFMPIIRVGAPLIRLLGGQLWLARVFALQRQLKACPAACRTLFRRRSRELRGELVHDQLAQLRMPVTVLMPEALTPLHEVLGKAVIRALPTAHLTSLPSGETPWELALEPTAEALRTAVAGARPPSKPT